MNKKSNPAKKALELVQQNPKDAEAYAALMRQLPIHTEQDDPDLVAAFKDIDEFLEAIEEPDEEAEPPTTPK